jgi:HSP20 family molecular chaperone IbpA
MGIQPNDNDFTGIDELIRRIIAESQNQGNEKPILIGIKVVIMQPPAGLAAAPETDHAPDVEIHRVGNEVKLITDLPGMSAENVQVLFRGTTVHIRACDGSRSFETSAEVPPADRDSVAISFRHGVLEVSYRERPPATPQGYQ